MRSSSFLGAMLCTPLLAICLHAQVPTGTLSGIARDPGGASISGASVQATDLARGTTRQTVANSGDGSFVLSDLLPGTYKVLLMAPGFAILSTQISAWSPAAQSLSTLPSRWRNRPALSMSAPLAPGSI